MPNHPMVRATYYIESSIDPGRAAAILAGEQSSGTFIAVPGDSDRLRQRHAARVVDVNEHETRPHSLPSRGITPASVRSATVTVDFPLDNIGTDLATLHTTIAGNLFELAELYACRLLDLRLPEEFLEAHPGPAFGGPGTRRLLGDPEGVMVGTIVKPNVGLSENEYRAVVRELAQSGIDLVKDDELMTDPSYLPLERRVAIATEEIERAADRTGHPTVYAFNITGDLAGLRRRHDLVVAAGGRCVMLNVALMGLPALAFLRSFSDVPIHGHRAGLAASMRAPGVGVEYRVWQQLARLAGADHLHVSGLRSKFYETDDEVAGNIQSLLEPLGGGKPVLPVLSSGQSVATVHPTYEAVKSTDLLMLAGGGVAAHPDGVAAGVRSLRQAWSAAVAGISVEQAARDATASGDQALEHALAVFGGRA